MEFQELRALLDTMSYRLESSWRSGNTEWTNTVEGLLRDYARGVGRTLLKVAPKGKKHFVLIWPGINLRLGQRHLSRYFLPAPAPLNGLPIKSGALIYCSDCANSAAPQCAEGHPQATAPLYAFDHLLSEDRKLKLLGSESVDLPVLGTHTWLLSEPRFRHRDDEQEHSPLWVLRVANQRPRDQDHLFDTSFYRDGLLSVYIGGDSDEFGTRLGAAVEFLHQKNKQWPYRPGQQPLDNIHLHRRIYDLWLTSVFAPIDLYSQLMKASNLFDLPPDLGRVALQLKDGVPYQEWISWRLAPTVPVLGEDSAEDKELGPELGSLMVLTTFPMGDLVLDPMGELALGSFMDRLRHNTEHAYLKLRTGDDAKVTERWATALAVAPIEHELRKWAGSLRWAFERSSPDPDWASLLNEPWESTALHRELAALYADALFFITLDTKNDLGLVIINNELDIASSIVEAFRVARALFILSVARVLGDSLAKSNRDAAVSLTEIQKQARGIPIAIKGSDYSSCWLDFEIDTATLAYVTHVLVTHLLNFLRHGDWVRGVHINVHYDTLTRTVHIIGHNLAAVSEGWSSQPSLQEVFSSLNSSATEARPELVDKLASSMRTLRIIEQRSGNRVNNVPATPDAGLWRWGLTINAGADMLQQSA